MATVKIVLRQKENKDGTFPLAIRITKDRKTSFIHLGYSINENDWDATEQRVKKQHSNHARLNNYIIKKLAEANDMSLELETQKAEITSRAVKQKIKPSGGATFFTQSQLYLDTLKKSGKFNRYSADRPRIERFKAFLENTDIAFSDISVSLLKKFKAYLKVTHKISDRTIINYLVLIRTIFNQAISENIVDRKYYPFGKTKIVIKFPDSLKIGLSPKEVKDIEELDLSNNPPLNHARNLWLFSFYFAGMRISDVLRLKWSDFQNDRLHYSMGKNDKGGSLKVPEKALKIVQQYKRDTPIHNLVFPDLENLEDLGNLYAVQRRINQRVKTINEYLEKVATEAEIDKKLTTHIARHTFGNISGDRIPIQMLQKLYRHSSVITTIGYQANFMHKDADDALEAVIGN